MKTKQLLRYAQLAADYLIWSNDDPQANYPGDVPLLVSKLGERICDCGDSEQEHSGPDHHCPRDQGVFSHARRPRPSDAVLLVGGHCSGWGVNCAWKGCSFRTPEFTVAWAAREAIVGHIKSTHLAPAQPAAPASEPAVRAQPSKDQYMDGTSHTRSRSGESSNR